MNLNTIANQTVALAGIAQATELVHQLASTGVSDDLATEASIASVLKIDSDSVIDIYGNLSKLALGIDQLDQHLSTLRMPNSPQVRYAIALIFLADQLPDRPDLLKTIQIGLIKAQTQCDHFGLMHDYVLANLADTYRNTISTLQPRVLVNGNDTYLSNPQTVNKIRALLLAGIRSAYLWRQCGGSRWKLLFYGKSIKSEVKSLSRQAR